MKRLQASDLLEGRNVTVNLIRDSTVTLLNEVIEEDAMVRKAIASAAQHTEGTSSKYYNMSRKRGVSVDFYEYKQSINRHAGYDECHHFK